MALRRLANLGVGTTVVLQETDTSRADWIVVSHSYGGNTLLARKAVLGAQVYDGSYNGMEWTASSLYKYLNETWVNGLCAGTRALLQSTGNGTAFIPSKAEMGVGSSTASLPADGQNALCQCVSGECWLRDKSEVYNEETQTWTTDGQYYVYTYTGSGGTQYAASTEDGYRQKNVLVCVCVSGSLAVDGSGLVRENHTPVIECEYSAEEDIGARSHPFRFYYRIGDSDGDEVTVTETVGVTVTKTYSPALGQTQYFSISQTLYDALEDDQYYDLKITVSDGHAGNAITLRFLKSAQRGYRVYAGIIDTKVNGAAVAAGSYAFSEKVCIYDPVWADEARTILDPTVIMEKNNFGSFEFTMPKENAYYDKIALRKTFVTVEEDGVSIWNGYVLELSKNFKMDKVVYCRGELGYLQDIACSVASREWNAKELFENIMSQTASAGIKACRAGQISSEFADEEVDTTDSGTQYTTVWGALNDILLGKTGGILRLRLRRDKTTSYGVGYTRYLDYLVDVPDRTSQTIEFGKNLLDLDYQISGYDIVNRIKVYGYETKGWWFWKKTAPIVETVSDDDSIAKYGVVERSLFVEGTKSTRDELRRLGKKKLKEMSAGIAGSIEIGALDLRDVGVDVNRLGFMKKAHILSEEHGIDQWELCTRMEIPLNDPAGKTFTFGETMEAISMLQAEESSAARRALSSVESIIGYINGNS